MIIQKTKLIQRLDSRYRSLQSQINYSGSAEEWRPWTEPSEFAAGVVANALKKNSKVWYWRGANTFLTWFAVTFLPHAFLVSSLVVCTYRLRKINLSVRIGFQVAADVGAQYSAKGN